MFIPHLWLPKAHVEAPVRGSIILSMYFVEIRRLWFIKYFCNFIGKQPFLPFLSLKLVFNTEPSRGMEYDEGL